MADKEILLVEDSPDDVELAMLAFERFRLAARVVVAWDGQEAIDYLFAEGPHTGRDPVALPQFVLLDLNLPKVDGLTVLRRIRDREATRRLPVVILTSSREHEDVMRGYDLGANSYVRKPIASEQFSTAIQQLQLYWLVINEPPR